MIPDVNDILLIHPIVGKGSFHEINKLSERIKRNLFKTDDKIADIESQKRPQSECKEWHERVKASNSYRPMSDAIT